MSAEAVYVATSQGNSIKVYEDHLVLSPKKGGEVSIPYLRIKNVSYSKMSMLKAGYMYFTLTGEIDFDGKYMTALIKENVRAFCWNNSNSGKEEIYNYILQQINECRLAAGAKVKELFEEFRHGKYYCCFNEEGVIIDDAKTRKIYPYGSMNNIDIISSNLTVDNGFSTVHRYILTDKKQEMRIRELLPFIRRRNENANPTSVITEDVSDAEHRMQCSTCGHVYCFNNADLRLSWKNQNLATLSSLGAVAGAVGGARMDMYELNKQADRASGKVIDFYKCPHCNSSSVKELSDDEFNKVTAENTATQQTTTVSAADEIKKFKELFDMGVITQEEFDAKKKQLLGL